MDWDLKLPSSDFSELERDAAHGIGAVLKSRSLQQPASSSECSVDLKLGGLGDFGPTDRPRDKKCFVSKVPTPSGTSRRARPLSNSIQNAYCLVEGCKADLSKCREYYRRHKVCEVHSKTPIVIVGGQEMRFCQQCSRFHMLAEFDEGKRSCRKRLDGHNRRRRKPQPDPNNSCQFFSSQRGMRFSSYPQIHSPIPSYLNWPGILKTEECNFYDNHQPLHLLERPQQNISFTDAFKGAKQIPFPKGTSTFDQSSKPETISVPSLHEFMEGNKNNKVFTEGVTQVLDFDCALSLLSIPPQNSEIAIGQMAPSDNRIPMSMPLLPSLSYNGLGEYSHLHNSGNASPTGFYISQMEDENACSVLVSEASGTNFNSNGMFHGDGTIGSVPFSWQ